MRSIIRIGVLLLLPTALSLFRKHPHLSCRRFVANQCWIIIITLILTYRVSRCLLAHHQISTISTSLSLCHCSCIVHSSCREQHLLVDELGLTHWNLRYRIINTITITVLVKWIRMDRVILIVRWSCPYVIIIIFIPWLMLHKLRACPSWSFS